MARILLVDFGSTYTKLVAVDLDDEIVLGQSKSVTTVEEDIMLGLRRAMERLTRETGLRESDFDTRLACSSAAGGLRVIAVGLVRELTAEAASQAALGAGARVCKVFAYKLSSAEAKEIDESAHDLILLAGGTDGGDEEVILHNARALSECESKTPVVVAGNKVVAQQVADVLKRSGREVRVASNVMPALGKIDTIPARQAIRRLYMERIVEAKGLDKAKMWADGTIMPTPAAVLHGAKRLADGTYDEPGAGEVMVVDVGGATTDVHSIADGRPSRERAIFRGLPEPYAKRTVEGDLGLRVSAESLLHTVGPKALTEMVGGKCDIGAWVRRLHDNVGFVPTTGEERAVDTGLGKAAVKQAVFRHVGRLKEISTPAGVFYLQKGKDLTHVNKVLGTGGIFAHSEEPRVILEEALYHDSDPLALRPKTPRLFVDRSYVLWAVGLLDEVDSDRALRILRRYLVEV
ncbi:MAG: methylaspartate mutase accessory protein GlmL [Bacillota bacterium]|jgi:uncharacterized protein (TIGR01319 family)